MELFLAGSNQTDFAPNYRLLKKFHRKSPRKLLSVSSKLESAWVHIITNIVTVSSDDNWLRKVKEVVDKEQGRSIWVAEEGKVSYKS